MIPTLPKDPYSIIITGVGGQGNVMASRLLGSMLVSKGYYVTVGETFGAAQRGGSVMSHIRISEQSVWSPQIPSGQADSIVALEPIEAIRVLARYGNPRLTVLCNTRSIYPVSVIKGEATYPDLTEIKQAITRLVPDTRFIDATQEAQSLGNPILANIIMLGALCGIDILPLQQQDFEETIIRRLPADQLTINLNAFAKGVQLVS